LDGWRLVRFSARQIERDPAGVAERLAGLLRGGA
jgi:very-short-patch-repair endonuclease